MTSRAKDQPDQTAHRALVDAIAEEVATRATPDRLMAEGPECARMEQELSHCGGQDSIGDRATPPEAIAHY